MFEQISFCADNMSFVLSYPDMA